MNKNENWENKDIAIDIFESLEIDYKPEKPKKKRRTDDYDYNDDFLEPFEGEFDVVEVNCKLENFYVYKGIITEDPKRIARRYNNSLKKNKLVDILLNKDQKESENSKRTPIFEFESKLASSINPNYKYKKDIKFDHLFMWVIFMESPETPFEEYLKYKLLSLYRGEEYSSKLENLDISNIDLEIELDKLKIKIDEIFNYFLKTVAQDSNFSQDKKTFELFKEEEFINKMIEFIILYTKFYIMKIEDSYNYIRNSALDYLSAMMPEQCTNKIKIKHYITKDIMQRIQNTGYSYNDIIEGRFIKSAVKEDGQPEFKPENQSMNLDSTVNSDNKYQVPSTLLFTSKFINSNKQKMNTNVSDKEIEVFGDSSLSNNDKEKNISECEKSTTESSGNKDEIFNEFQKHKEDSKISKEAIAEESEKHPMTSASTGYNFDLNQNQNLDSGQIISNQGLLKQQENHNGQVVTEHKPIKPKKPKKAKLNTNLARPDKIEEEYNSQSDKKESDYKNHLFTLHDSSMPNYMDGYNPHMFFKNLATESEHSNLIAANHNYLNPDIALGEANTDNFMAPVNVEDMHTNELINTNNNLFPAKVQNKRGRKKVSKNSINNPTPDSANNQVSNALFDSIITDVNQNPDKATTTESATIATQKKKRGPYKKKNKNPEINQDNTEEAAQS